MKPPTSQMLSYMRIAASWEATGKGRPHGHRYAALEKLGFMTSELVAVPMSASGDVYRRMTQRREYTLTPLGRDALAGKIQYDRPTPAPPPPPSLDLTPNQYAYLHQLRMNPDLRGDLRTVKACRDRRLCDPTGITALGITAVDQYEKARRTP